MEGKKVFLSFYFAAYSYAKCIFLMRTQGAAYFDLYQCRFFVLTNVYFVYKTLNHRCQFDTPALNCLETMAAIEIQKRYKCCLVTVSFYRRRLQS